jgi:hypothetical protein
MIAPLIAAAFTAPLFHYHDSVKITYDCTPQVAFYKLKNKTGHVESFTRDNGAYTYRIAFNEKEYYDIEVPEQCLQSTKGKK